jgi:multimeric flavodoxin WrbA
MSRFLKLLEEAKIANNPAIYTKKLDTLIEHLKGKKNILLLTTSNRWEGDKEQPKSTQMAEFVKKEIGNQSTVELIDVSKLTIHCCEGNVSRIDGNNCGVKDAVLKDKEKNPTGNHRCWASINNKDDELWKISKPLFEADTVVFFTSVRWGQANSVYQKLIERLNWLENRHTTLKEENIIKDKEAGVVILGQNWNGETVLQTQKKVLGFYGFKVPEQLSLNWQYTDDTLDETAESYKKAPKAFEQAFDINLE